MYSSLYGFSKNIQVSYRSRVDALFIEAYPSSPNEREQKNENRG